MWWTSADGRLKAVNMFNQLQIATVAYLDRRDAKIKAMKDKKLEGF